MTGIITIIKVFLKKPISLYYLIRDGFFKSHKQILEENGTLKKEVEKYSNELKEKEIELKNALAKTENIIINYHLSKDYSIDDLENKNMFLWPSFNRRIIVEKDGLFSAMVEDENNSEHLRSNDAGWRTKEKLFEYFIERNYIMITKRDVEIKSIENHDEGIQLEL